MSSTTWQPWGLSPSQAGLLVSSGLVGFLFGAVGHGTVADRLGRRGTLLAGLWIVNVFTLLTATIGSDFWSFCALRFATGLGLGVLLPLGTTFVNELAPRRVSNAFSLWGVTLGWSLGGVCAGLVGVYLTPHYGWQILYYLGALSIPLTFVVHGVLPESPQFLAARRRTEELRALLARLRPERAVVYRMRASSPATEGSQNPIAAPAEPALSPRLADDLDHRVPQPVRDLRPDRLDPDRDAEARRDLCRIVRLRRADAGDVVRRRADACDAGRPQDVADAAPPRNMVADRRHCRAGAGVRQRSRRQSRDRRYCRVLHHRRAARAQQFHRGLIRDPAACQRRWHGIGCRPGRRDPRALCDRVAAAGDRWS